MTTQSATGAATTSTSTTITAGHRPIRQINDEIRRALDQGTDIDVLEPLSRHNLGVALTGPAQVTFKGSVGYYCGGLSDGSMVRVEGNSGWGTGEGMATGRITVTGNAGMSVGAAMRGGTIHVGGDAGPRCGVAMKGGDIVVEGDIGHSTGFMAHGGRIVCLGNAKGSVGDSLWQGTVWVAGSIETLGIDAVVQQPAAQDVDAVEDLLESLGIRPGGHDWKQVVAGKKLWYFEARDAKQWLMI